MANGKKENEGKREKKKPLFDAKKIVIYDNYNNNANNKPIIKIEKEKQPDLGLRNPLTTQRTSQADSRTSKT